MNAPLDRSADAQRLRLTARDFWQLAETGAFEDHAKVELIEGELWVVNSIWAWHARTTAHFVAELTIALRQLRSPLVVYGAGSVDLSDDSVPEPDICVGADTDGRGIPLGAVRLAIEVSDSSAARDLGLKARLYGAAGIPEYWVVDRQKARIVQMWAPAADGYAEQRDIAFGDAIAAVTLSDLRIDTAAVRA